MTETILTDEFEKDLKKIRKKYPSIDDDLNLFLTALICILPKTLSGAERIAGLGEKYSEYPIFKATHFRCSSLKGCGARSGIRVIYEYNAAKDRVALIHMYCKSKQDNHDVLRIVSYLDAAYDL